LFNVSTVFIPASIQDRELSLAYAQSAYGILAMNETLPPFTKLNYTLAPFRTDDLLAAPTGTWTANTTLYTMDVYCDNWEPEPVPDMYGGLFYRNSECYIGTEQFNNLTVGVPAPWPYPHVAPWAYPKEFSALYAASAVQEDYYFGGYTNRGRYYCNIRDGSSGRHTFFAGLVRNKLKESEPSNPVTALFCKPAYYQQQVEATVDARTKSPVRIVPLQSKRPLVDNVFNQTVFESTIANGKRQVNLRDNILPVRGLPRYLQQLYTSELTASMVFTGELPPMLAMALMTANHTMEELLESRLLAEAYQNAYRLLFVLAMTDVLATDFSSSVTTTAGQLSSQEEAVILEPIFACVVVGLLAIVSFSMLALLYVTSLSCGGKTLVDDPGTHSNKQCILS
jgi:hypothetical protein